MPIFYSTHKLLLLLLILFEAIKKNIFVIENYVKGI